MVFVACKQGNEKSVQPNIILICADDLGWSDIGCYGSEIKTPNLDRLANEGIRFTQFHNTAKCFPSRASLLTGVYAHDCGYNKIHTNSITNAVTIGEVLQEAGYLTYWSGKHHGKDNPYHLGFNHYYGLKDGCCNYFNPGKPRDNEEKPAQKHKRHWCIDSTEYHPFTPQEKDFYTTDYFTKYAIDYINEAKDKESPFFLYLAYTAPHDPLMAWPEDIKKYEGMYDVGYDKIRKDRFNRQLASGLVDSDLKLSEASYVPWQSLSEEEKIFESDKMEVYAAMIDRMDQNIGLLLSNLKRLSMMDNTIILFMSDNGASAELVNLKNDNDLATVGSLNRWISLGKSWANVCNTPYRFYKNYSFEGGINTPLIVWWPETVKANSFSQFQGHFIDIMPTILEISGAEYPKQHKGNEITPLRGMSLLSVLRGEEQQRNSPLFWQWNKGAAMSLEQWKIVKHGIDSDWELYNLENDPTEINNLASEFSEKVVQMDALYKKWISTYE